jgi:5-formyltetrahydrofolate cyclo-ligase
MADSHEVDGFGGSTSILGDDFHFCCLRLCFAWIWPSGGFVMTSPRATATAELKAKLRRTVMAQRRETHIARKGQAASNLSERLLTDIPHQEQTIAGYWPLGEELDCRQALEALRAAGAIVALPVVAGQGQVLIFRCWTPGDIMDAGPFGTVHPSPRAPLVAPTILLLPLIAFDCTGHRLGYGAGYYDRTVAALRHNSQVLTVGLAYDEQEVEAVPVDSHDQRMDAVVTDRRTLWFNASLKP